MKAKQSPQQGQNQKKKGVRAPYTFDSLQSDLLAQQAALGRDFSLRKVAAKYGVSHAVIQRVLAGVEPTDPTIRKALGLPHLKPAPVCPVHGVVHLGGCPRPKRAPESLSDWTVKSLAEAIRNRTLIEGE